MAWENSLVILHVHLHEVLHVIDRLSQQLDKEVFVGRLVLGHQGLHAVQVNLPLEKDRTESVEPLQEVVAMELLFDELHLAEPLLCKVLTLLLIVAVEER